MEIVEAMALWLYCEQGYPLAAQKKKNRFPRWNVGRRWYKALYFE